MTSYALTECIASGAAEIRNTAGSPCIIGSSYGISHALNMEVRVGTVLYFVLVAVVFQCVQVQIASAVACTVDASDKCKCKLVDNTGEIDLHPLFAGGKLSAQGTGPE